MHKITCSIDKYVVVVLYVLIYISSDILMYVQYIEPLISRQFETKGCP